MYTNLLWIYKKRKILQEFLNVFILKPSMQIKSNCYKFLVVWYFIIYFSFMVFWVIHLTFVLFIFNKFKTKKETYFFV